MERREEANCRIALQRPTSALERWQLSHRTMPTEWERRESRAGRMLPVPD